jgi:hypothetical protein
VTLLWRVLGVISSATKNKLSRVGVKCERKRPEGEKAGAARDDVALYHAFTLASR